MTDKASTAPAAGSVLPFWREHVLKTWPPFFRALVTGLKTFEARRDDRGFAEGDILVLREYDPHHDVYTGGEVRARVTYVMHGGDHGIQWGHVVMGLEVFLRKPSPEETSAASAPQAPTESVSPTALPASTEPPSVAAGARTGDPK